MAEKCMCLDIKTEKRTDVSYTTKDNIFYIDIIITFCNDCGGVKDVEEY